MSGQEVCNLNECEKLVWWAFLICYYFSHSKSKYMYNPLSNKQYVNYMVEARLSKVYFSKQRTLHENVDRRISQDVLFDWSILHC